MKRLKLTLLTLLLPFAVFALAEPVITTNSLPGGKIGVPYSGWLEATEEVNWSISDGALPTGLVLELWCTESINFCFISGTPNSEITSGTEFTFKVKAVNPSNEEFQEKEFTITFVAPAAPEITTTSLPNGKKGASYNGRLNATEYANWTLIDGTSLPPGLALDPSGNIWGTPTTVDTYNFTVKAENATSSDSKSLSITIVELPAPVIQTTSLPNGKAGVYYGEPIETSEFVDNCEIEDGELPEGLDLYRSYYYNSGHTVCFISGTPENVDTYTFTVKATNATSSDSKAFTITIAPLPAPIIKTTSLQNGKVGSSYWDYLDATEDATWSKESGNLPPGLDLYPGGRIDGTPTTAGTYNFTVKATNATSSDSKAFTITIAAPAAPVIQTTSLNNGKVGQPYWGYLNAAEYATWSIASGNLPPGLELYSYSNSSYSRIEGTPTTAGTYNFTVKATNVTGSRTKAFTITITTPAAPVITTESLQNGKKDAPYWGRLNASDYAEWSLEEGSLPPGLDLDTDGYIDGTPTTVGTYTFTVKATNVSGEDEQELTIEIVMPEVPEITTAELENGKVGAPYNGWLDATEYAEWSIASGSLPPGFTLHTFSDGGYIYGTPTTVGTYTFTIKATNAAGDDTKELTLEIVMPEIPQIATTSLPNGKVGVSYNKSLEASEYARWSVISGSLPPGLRLYTDGYIYGTPTTAGTYTFTVKATNAADEDTKQLSIRIDPATATTPQPPIVYPTPIATPQIAAHGNVLAQTTANSISLSNIPSNAKVEVYNLQGKRIYSANSGNFQTMEIQVQAKGMYVVKVGSQAIRAVVR